MSLFDGLLPEDNNTRGNVLDAIQAMGMGMMQGDRNHFFGTNLAQNLAAIQAGNKAGMGRDALRLLLKNAGADEATANTLSASPEAAKSWLAQAEKKKNFSQVMTLAGTAPTEGGDDAPSAPAPVSNLGMGVPGALAPPAGNTAEIQNKFVGALKDGGLTNPNALGALAAYAQHESQYSPDNIVGSWPDPSQKGQPGTSGGILSWRNERLGNMRAATAGAKDPVVAQAQFTLNENPQLTAALQNAKSPEEANALLAEAWKFAGYDKPGGGEYARRLATTQAYAKRFVGASGGPTQVASADPSFVPQNVSGASAGAPKAASAPVAGTQQPVAALKPPSASQGEDSDTPALPGTVPSAQTAGSPAEQSRAASVARQAMPVLQQPPPPANAGNTTQLAYAKRLKTWAEQMTVVAPTLGETGKGLSELAKTRLDEANKIISQRTGAPFKDENGTMWQIDANGNWLKRDEAQKEPEAVRRLKDAQENWQKYNLPDPNSTDPSDRAYWRNMATKALSGVTTDITNNVGAGETEGQKVVGKAKGEVQAEDIAMGKASRQKVDVLNTMEGALDAGGKNIATGPFGEQVLKIKQGIAQLTGEAPAGTTPAEILKKSNSQLAAASAKALTSRPAQQEFINFTKNNPGLDISYEGNKFFINILKQEAQRETAISSLAMRHKGTPEQYAELRSAYEDAHPIINPFTSRPFGETPDGPNAGGQGSTAPAQSGRASEAPASQPERAPAPAPMTTTDKARTIAQAKEWAKGKTPEQIQRVRDNLAKQYGIVTDAF